MKITKREILLSIAIIAIMLTIGMMIHQSISDSLMIQYQEYNTALKANEDKSLFEYGMRTNIGNAFVYGELKALNPVTYPEIDGEYAEVKKVKERYTRHTRTRTYTVNGKTRIKTEYYWTWDAIDSWYLRTDKISFLDIEFNYGDIEFPSLDYICTQKESSHIRYVYYGTPVTHNGTIYTKLLNNTINDTTFYPYSDIESTIKHLESGYQLIIFWIVWTLITIGIVIGFYAIENNWLEDERNNRHNRRKHYKKKIDNNHFGRGCAKSEFRFRSTYLN